MIHKGLKGKIICNACNKEVPYSSWQSHIHKEFLLFGIPLNHLKIELNLSNFKYKIPEKIESLWDFDYVLPISHEKAISLKEGNTPLYHLINYGGALGLQKIYLKDESKNPTGSFKDRGSSLMISHAKILGKKKIAIPSCGNAALSIIKYAKKAQIHPIIFVPKNIAPYKLEQIQKGGVEIKIVDGSLKEVYSTFLNYVKKNPEVYSAFPVNNPFYFQGLKTAAYEIFIQLKNVPDWIIVPCGGGNNLYALYLGFKELYNLKLIKKLPKFVCVQIKGADPLCKGFLMEKFKEVHHIQNPVSSIADAIVASTSYNYFNVMEVLTTSKGKTVSVTDEEIKDGYLEFLHIENELVLQKKLFFEPTSGVIFPALKQMKKFIKPDELVVLIATGSWKKGSVVEWLNKKGNKK